MTPLPPSDIDDHDAALRSLATLTERVASIPEALRAAADVTLPMLHRAPRTVVATGIGASEGPARLLVRTLADAGVAARFEPLARFAITSPTAELLVVFSQNLSPNARLALTAEHRFGARWLVTSAGYAPGVSARESLVDGFRAQGILPILVPPAAEDGMLIRVVGPAAASLVGLRIAAAITGDASALPNPQDAVDGYNAAGTLATPVVTEALSAQPLALITAGVSAEAVHGHRWKLLETLLRDDPPVWDVLQVAHGPLQTIHDRPMTLLVLSTPRAAHLVSRLRTALCRKHHEVRVWSATHDNALSFFEHAAAIDACLLATLRAHPRNLFTWPGRGGDAPLYDLGG